MSTHVDYAELIRQAEQAVSPVKDPELKRIAFEKVLDTLLSGGVRPSAGDEHKGRHSSKKVASKASSTGGRKRSSGPQGYIEDLIGDSFFKTPKTLSAVKAELVL